MNMLSSCQAAWRLFFGREKSDLRPLSREEYYRELSGDDEDRARRAFDRAWETRNFEIGLYWKRAAYFWAFIASAFVGYFALVRAGNSSSNGGGESPEAYLLVCIGFTLSVAWLLTNRGSKAWQRHWEAHIDLLEDRFTGPLYKTVHVTKTFSVSKINEVVSGFFCLVWLMLGAKYLVDQDLLNFCSGKIDWVVLLSTVWAVLAVLAMFRGHGRGRFGRRGVLMYRRAADYEELQE